MKPKLGDKEVEVLLEKVLLEKPVNEVSQAEMTEHLSGRHGERTDDRQDYRNGSYER